MKGEFKMNFENVNYKIFNPGGNKTALVIGNEYNSKERKLINDNILNIAYLYIFYDEVQIGDLVLDVEFDL